MILKFLRGLGAGKSKNTAVREAVDYKGFSIVPTPRKVQGGWTTEGTISKSTGDDTRSEHFIRADMLMSEQDAVDYSVAKAKKIIDEQGDRLLKD
ncbi:MAG: HlyU family transcriptional regulator [Gammaproteobacteria bacterium]|nr:MAG: HlyU family transcriptional regulator [Gammaproteobacteria bacterium]